MSNDTPTRSLAAEERFMAKVHKDPETGCWLWTAGRNHGGYGDFRSGRTYRAHRWGYEHFIGPIPDGLQLDHLCRVRHCVNPAHLEPVTSRENTLRGDTIPASEAARTVCPAGHPYTPENTYRHRGAKRRCVTCHRTYMATWKAMSPAERAARKTPGLPVVDLAALFAA